MKNRLIIAVALSFLVLIFWQSFMSKVYHIDNTVVTQESPINQTVNPKSSSMMPDSSLLLSSSGETKESSPRITLDRVVTDKLEIEFINPGASIYRVYLKDYKLNTQITGALYSRLFQDEIYTLQKNINKIELSKTKSGHSLIQRLNFRNNSYNIDLETIYKNESGENWTLNDDLILTSVYRNLKPEDARLYEAVFIDNESQSSKRKNIFTIKDRYVHSESWTALAFRDRYATIIIKPEDTSKISPFIVQHNSAAQTGLALGNIIIPPSGQFMLKSRIYCGPQDVNLLKDSKLGFEEVVHYGTFDFISTALLAVMNFFHRVTHSWGVALILLSLFIYSILYPLTLKQMRSMKEMQELQPKIEAIRKSCKDNPQRQNKEIMELYKNHKVNPMGGCLPMILQIPIFFGLYQALSRSISLKGSGFLWIKDLAEPDKLFLLSQSLPFIGKEINILPILMAIAMFFQQKISLKSSAAANSQAMEQQKMMLVLMPVMFGFIFYHFPSGLALYWFLSTILTTVSQWKTLKIKTLVPKN